MHYGVVMFATEYAIAPDELARALEERGFESVWFPEHTHIPASRRSPWPGGGELPREYWSSYDPFIALMAAGAATKRLKLGAGICLVIDGDRATTFDRVVEFGDGWMPITRPSQNPLERIPELRERLKKAGRDPKTAPVSIFFAPPKKEGLDRLASAGVERAIFGLPSEGRESVLPRLDAFAKLIS